MTNGGDTRKDGELWIYPKGNWAEGYVSPSFFVEGMAVLLPWEDRKGLKCRVERAVGNHARITNEEHGVDLWVGLLDVAIEGTCQ